jgi:hypothetical protein
VIDHNDTIKQKFELNGYAEGHVVNKDILEIMNCYSEILWNSDILNIESNVKITSQNETKSYAKYGLLSSEIFLLYFKSIYSEIIGKELVPTYSFTRKYVRGNYLGVHSDRPSCQYSITINIGASSNKPWPFFCQKIGTDQISKLNTPLFVPIFYKGEEVLHWREELDKDYSIHMFLHYVDKNDKNYRKFWYDGRSYLGH